MRIIHIITRLIFGGAQENTVRSCEHQLARGHDVTLVHGPIYGPEGSLADRAATCGATVVVEPSMRRAILPWHDWRCYHALRRLIRQIKPDIVHTHSSKAGILGRAAAWAEGVPGVIHTVHGLPFHDGQFVPVRRAYMAAERFAARRCHRIIGVTDAMIDAFKANDIGRDEQFDVVPSGVDVAFFEGVASQPGLRDRVRDELQIPRDAPLVGMIGRLDRLKGQDDLLDIAPRLGAELPAARVVFVGDGWHAAHLRARVEAEGLSKMVIFTGFVDQQRLAELASAFDVSVLPSHQEGQPRTLIQSLLCGCPIVGYDVGGIPEICIESKTGRVVPTRDRDALLDAIVWTLTHRDEAQQLAEAGRNHVREKFDQSRMLQKLDRIYEELMATDEHR